MAKWNHQITALVDDETRTTIEKLTKTTGMGLGAVVREALAKGLPQVGKKPVSAKAATEQPVAVPVAEPVAPPAIGRRARRQAPPVV